MASDKLRQVGRYMRLTERQADLALKRYTNKIPKKERARDTVSSVFPFRFDVQTDGRANRITVNINFNKPPPDDCGVDCISTACIDFQMGLGAHSISLPNPYIPGTVRVYGQGDTIEVAQFIEENPSGGQVYVQVNIEVETVVICFSYITC